MKKRAPIGGDLLRRVECYPTSNDETTLCIQVVNTETGAVSECVNEHPNKNFLWMRQKPVANTPGPQTSEKVVLALGQGERVGVNNRVIKIIEEAGVFMVVGDWTGRYKHEEVNAYDAKGIAFDPLVGDGGTLALRRSATAINLHEVLMLDDVFSVAASFERRSEPETREYTVSKLTSNGKLMFGREPVAVEDWAYIYDAIDTTAFDSDPAESGAIQFLPPTELIGHKKTYAFDVDGEYAIVLWEDDRGNLRLRV